MENTIKFSKLGLSLDVSRTAFTIFGIDIYWYGLIIAAGLVFAFIYAVKEAAKQNIKQDDLLNMFIIAVPCSVIGARLYYVIFSLSEYKNNLIDIFNIRGGGLAIYGGIIAAFLTVIIYCRRKKINPYTVLDILAVGLLIGQAIGRWGNFVNGEAFGSETTSPLAMTIITDGLTVAENVHPTFLYESAWNAAGIFILLMYKRKKLFEGELFSLYLFWYGLGRFMIEKLRADSLYIGDIKVSQIVSAIIIFIGIIFIIRGRKLAKLNENSDELNIDL